MMTSTIKFFLRQISYLGLVLSILPAAFVFRGQLSMQSYYWLMVLGMLLWFGSAVFWIKPDVQGAKNEQPAE